MDQLFISSFDNDANRWNISIKGEIDLFNSGDFKDKLNELCSQKQTDLYINCSELEYIDSTGIGTLVSVLKTVKLYGGVIRLSGLRSHLLKVFKITDLNKIFIIEGDEHE